MRRRMAALLLPGIQLALVLSIAGKYWYERKTCPRVWVRATQMDPEQPLRGRYLALQLLVDACGLPRDAAHFHPGFRNFRGEAGLGSWMWTASLAASGGHLTPSLDEHSGKAGKSFQVSVEAEKPCEQAAVRSDEEYFVPEHAKGPFPLQPGQELWVEVTLPPSGPPRPIQLGLADRSGLKPLTMK